MEILVSTVIFAVVVSSLMSLFNYVLKINRKSEALRQASQGMRNFAETLAKNIRNGEIDFGMNGTHDAPRSSDIGPCLKIANVGDNYYGLSGNGKDNRLSIIDNEGFHQCIYFGDQNGNYVGSGFTHTNGTLVVLKEGNTPQILNPSNFKITQLAFTVKPTCDPYIIKPPGCSSYSSDYPKIQPFVQILMRFSVNLPTGETKEIYYQTSVSINKYDIPQ